MKNFLGQLARLSLYCGVVETGNSKRLNILMIRYYDEYWNRAGVQTLICEKQPGVIYDEARVPPYSLPDPLVSSDGLRILNPELWMKKRRLEILELFRTHMYGRMPIDKPEEMFFEEFDLDHKALGGSN